nr:12072_t:CDS:2 [Entrophospora candida]
MSVIINNSQPYIKLSKKLVTIKLMKILSFTNYSNWDLGAISPGNLPKPLTPEHQNLGDLIISIPYVINWCKRNNKYYTTCHSFKKTKRCLNIEKRLIELYVHGVLHLLGYDHESDDDYLMMNMKEKEMLKQFWKWKKDLRNRK